MYEKRDTAKETCQQQQKMSKETVVNYVFYRICTTFGGKNFFFLMVKDAEVFIISVVSISFQLMGRL